MLTIMGGQWSGRRLNVIERDNLRPTSGRVKSSIFSILEAIQWKRIGSPDFSGWQCCDLFAGVGGLGLEMLSRGAAHCTFVEKERAHAKILQENIAILGCETQSKVVQIDVKKIKWADMGPFDLVLLDPPYADSNLPELLECLASGDVVRQGGVILFEHDPKVRLDVPENLELHSSRKLGPAGISVFIRK